MKTIRRLTALIALLTFSAFGVKAMLAVSAMAVVSWHGDAFFEAVLLCLCAWAYLSVGLCVGYLAARWITTNAITEDRDHGEVSVD